MQNIISSNNYGISDKFEFWYFETEETYIYLTKSQMGVKVEGCILVVCYKVPSRGIFIVVKTMGE